MGELTLGGSAGAVAGDLDLGPGVAVELAHLVVDLSPHHAHHHHPAVRPDQTEGVVGLQPHFHLGLVFGAETLVIWQQGGTAYALSGQQGGQEEEEEQEEQHDGLQWWEAPGGVREMIH